MQKRNAENESIKKGFSKLPGGAADTLFLSGKKFSWVRDPSDGARLRHPLSLGVCGGVENRHGTSGEKWA